MSDNNREQPSMDDEMAPEYDFSGGVRSKHAQTYQQGYRVVIHKTAGTMEERSHTMQSKTSTFPSIETRNLEGRKFRLPADFEGDLNIVILAFQRWHQDIIDVWVPHLDALAERHPGLRIYELPTLANRYRLMQRFIDGGMAAGIASQTARERTLTIYTDKSRFLAPLGVTDESTITLLLVDRQGHVLWRASGPYTSATLASLEAALRSVV